MKTVQTRRFIGVLVALVGVVSSCSDGSNSGDLDIELVGSEVELADGVTTSARVGTAESPVFDFSAPDSANRWSVVNDTVMGGVSSGQLTVEGGSMVFSGELSLDNNGGFASVRSPVIEPQWAAAWSQKSGPRIQVEGDGRTWVVEVRTDDVTGGWIASLPTSSDSITDVTIPWTSFEAVTRFLDPRETDEPLDPRRIVSIAFYLVDGIEGPFRLGLLSIS